MSSRLQLDVRHLSLWRRHLVNAYKVCLKEGICVHVIAGKTVWSMPERLEYEVLQKERYISPLTSVPWPKSDHGFETSCLLHFGHLTVSANLEDSWKRFWLSRTRLWHLVTLAFGCWIQIHLLTFGKLSPCELVQLWVWVWYIIIISSVCVCVYCV